MRNTLVRIYDELSDAENARNELLRAGFDTSRIHLSARNDESGPVEGNFYVGDPVGSDNEEPSRHQGISGFLKSLIDSDKDDYNGTFRHVVQRGTYMLTIHAANEEEATAVCEITARHGALSTDNGTCGGENQSRPSV